MLDLINSHTIYAGTAEPTGGTVVGVYKAGGSIAFNQLPSLTADYLGFVYNITNAFTTTSDFVEGQGVSYGAGENIVIVNTGSQSNPVYKYDVMSGDTSSYQLISNLVTSISSASTDTQYPSAKCVYDIVGDIESILDTIIAQGEE